MKKLYQFECKCGHFSLGGYCPYCQTRRVLVYDDEQLMRIISPVAHLESVCTGYGKLGALFYRYCCRIAGVHIRSYIDYLLTITPAQMIPQLLTAKTAIEDMEIRIARNGIPMSELSTGELSQIHEILSTLDNTISETDVDDLFNIILKSGILNLLNNCVVKQ